MLRIFLLIIYTVWVYGGNILFKHVWAFSESWKSLVMCIRRNEGGLFNFFWYVVWYVYVVITLLQSGLLTSFLTPLMLCVLILYISSGTYRLNRLRTTDFLRNFSWQFYLLSDFLPEICWEEITGEIFFVFCSDVWPGDNGST